MANLTKNARIHRPMLVESGQMLTNIGESLPKSTHIEPRHAKSAPLLNRDNCGGTWAGPQFPKHLVGNNGRRAPSRYTCRQLRVTSCTPPNSASCGADVTESWRAPWAAAREAPVRPRAASARRRSAPCSQPRVLAACWGANPIGDPHEVQPRTRRNGPGVLSRGGPNLPPHSVPQRGVRTCGVGRNTKRHAWLQEAHLLGGGCLREKDRIRVHTKLMFATQSLFPPREIPNFGAWGGQEAPDGDPSRHAKSNFVEHRARKPNSQRPAL